MPPLVALALGYLVALAAAPAAAADELKVGDPAPLFTSQTHTGETFDLASRKGQWTVLYFYPKANTRGCTKQACAFRDGIDVIRKEGADVYGISTDSVQSQSSFHDEHHLSFTLLADPEGKVTEAYGAKMPILTMARRWTFIIGPELQIRQIQRDVNPEEDAQRVAAEIVRLKQESAAARP